MTWLPLDTWIVIVGFLAAASCALPGCYLVLRRMSLMGDAISHAVLPGLAIAFLLTGSRASLPMFLGAGIVGVLTAVFTQWVQNLGRVEATASLGIVFTTLFAIGLIMIRFAADNVDLDVDCVLYGAIEMTPWNKVDPFSAPRSCYRMFAFDLWPMLQSVGLPPLPWPPWHTLGVPEWRVPQAAVTNGVMLGVNATFIALFYKELKISSFDPQLATTLGFNAQVLHYVLMALVAATVVAAFESVGAILVIAMLIVPGATAHLLTDRLWVMLLISLGIAAGCAVGGHVGAIVIPPVFGFAGTTTAGMMAVAAGALFGVALLTGPRYGIVSRALGRLRLSLHIAQQDLLALLYRWHESAETTPITPRNAAATLHLGAGSRLFVLGALRRRGLITKDPDRLALTEAGQAAARDLVRSHRLWETYLAQFTHLPAGHEQLSAERLEHATDARLQHDLADRTGAPDTDPQGKRIPPGERRGDTDANH